MSLPNRCCAVSLVRLPLRSRRKEELESDVGLQFSGKECIDVGSLSEQNTPFPMSVVKTEYIFLHGAVSIALRGEILETFWKDVRCATWKDSPAIFPLDQDAGVPRRCRHFTTARCHRFRLSRVKARRPSSFTIRVRFLSKV